MTLDKETIKTIEAFVRERPRNMQEVARKVGKSWRTADRYVRQIAKEEGTIATHTFREGTRGALKVVYWAHRDQPAASQLQELLLRRIESGHEKGDFSPFDIYQRVDEEKRKAFLEEEEEEGNLRQDLAGALQQAEEQILIFSGDFSWANLQQEGRSFLDIFAGVAERGVSIKFLGRVDVDSVRNVRSLLDLNTRIGADRVRIRHYEQPLRAFTVDTTFARLKETKDTAAYRDSEEHAYIYYELYETKWVKWLQNVFWNFYRGAVPAEHRIDNLRTIRNLSLT